MGRILETLQRSSLNGPPDEGPPTTPPGLLEAPFEQEEMPYIEIGPDRSFEASATVLAAGPRPAPKGQARPVSQLPANSAVPATKPLARPHQVQFRSLAAPSCLAPDLVAFHAPNTPAGVRYGELLSSLSAAIASRTGERTPVLLFSGVRSGLGTTTVLLNAAITAARQGSRVIVLDANLRHAAVADRLGLDRSPGLTEVMGGECSLADALRPTEQPNLLALAAGSPVPLLASIEALRSLLDDLRTRSDLILVDGPHWDGRPAVSALASACDVVFLVLTAAEADTPAARDLLAGLPAQGVRLAGCILTGA